MLRPIVDSFVSWPTDVLRPSPSLWGRLARRIAAETGEEPVVPATRQWSEQQWEEVAPGISCKLLATDTERDRVSMLVRLAPGVTIRLTAMRELKSYICYTASCGSTTENSIPGTTTGRRPVPPINVCGARPAARAFSLRLLETYFADLPFEFAPAPPRSWRIIGVLDEQR